MVEPWAVRDGVSKRMRFEVFKRDGFRCRYCGRSAPDVVLQADHLLAVANGGPDEIGNLVTSCADCNGGKSCVPLGDVVSGPVPDVDLQDAKLDQMKKETDRMLQYQKRAAEVRLEQERAVGFLKSEWLGLFPAGRAVTTEKNFDAGLRMIWERLPLDEIADSMQITKRRSDDGRVHDYTAERYFFGVCWNKIKLREKEEQPEHVR